MNSGAVVAVKEGGKTDSAVDSVMLIDDDAVGDGGPRGSEGSSTVLMETNTWRISRWVYRIVLWMRFTST